MARSFTVFTSILVVSASSFLACSGSSGDDSASNDGDSGKNDASVDSGGGGDSQPSSDGSIPQTDAGADAAKPIAIDLTGCPQSGYNASFSIGGSSFALTVDTGSSDIGVVSAACSGCGTPDYTPGATATDQHQTGGVSYSSGQSWTGEIYSDTFSPAAGLAPQTKLVAITGQTDDFFAAASCGLDPDAIPISYQGIAGFGVASSATTGVEAPMAAFTGAGMPNIFSLALCGLGGKMWLGGFDPASASAAPTYTPLLSGFYYNIKLHDLGVGLNALEESGNIAEVDIDSNTTELELPQTVYNALKAAIGNDPAFTAHFGGPSFFANGDCIAPSDATPPTPDALDAALPTVTLQLDDGAGGSTPLTLKATTSYLQPITVSGVTKYCPEIEPSGSTTTIIGSSFVRSQVVVYDIAGSRIGFAPYAGCTTR
jgi:Eukaryotic aspartyl protease